MVGSAPSWLVVGRFAKVVGAGLLLIGLVVALVTALDGSLSLHSFSVGLFVAAGLLGAGYVFVMLGFKTDVSDYFLTQRFILPLDLDAAAAREREDEMQDVFLFLLALAAGLCAVGGLLLWIS